MWSLKKSVLRTSSLVSSATLFQLFRFGIVGGAATLTHYLVAIASFHFLSVSEYIANLFGYICAVGVSLFGQTFFTFKAELTRKVFSKFVSVSLATFLLSELLVLGLGKLTTLPFSIIMVFVVLFIPAVTFVMQKFWVYRT